MKRPTIYLTFDLEEFDIVQEYGSTIPWEEQIATTASGMELVETLLARKQVTATFFTTAAFALEQPALVQRLAATHEIASHSYWHSAFKDEDLATSRQVLQQISGQTIYGLRMPRMRQVPANVIKAAGYTYDSSLNPIRLPGRYNFIHLPRTVFFEKDLMRIPASVATNLRLPLFWLAFKNYPMPLFRYLARKAVAQDGYLNLYFHPWEFADLQRFALPWYVKKPSGQHLLQRLSTLVDDLKLIAEFAPLKNLAYEKALALGKGLSTITSS